ncbi:MAG: hypothetical protein PHF35_01130 [Candidatus Moranbacteria bacterium]|nr:hypothetical protein [Candidatus Moranbacteria bacterium]
MENNKQRKIDQTVASATQGLGDQFALISRKEVAAWKAYLIVLFVGGFFAAIIFTAMNSWYVGIKADNPPVIMSVVTDTDARKAGDEYTDHILLDTGTKAAVAVQAIATYDSAKVQIVSIDDSTSDFPYEVKNEDDSENGKIFVALGKPTPGVNSITAKVVDITVKALTDFSGSALTLKFDSTAAVDDSAAIEDDGNGTNILTQVKNVVTSPSVTDSTPPIVSGGSPSGTLSSGTASTTLRVLTNENATCKYGETKDNAYSSMANDFTNTGGKNHTSSLTSLEDGQAYKYYVRCKDTAGNVNDSDYTVSFSVDSGGGSKTGDGPAITKSSPSGELAAGTKSITLKIATSVNATCKYSSSSETSYSSIKNTFSKTGDKVSSTKIDGLENGQSYNYYVRCQDGSGNANTSDYVVSFSVAGGSGDTTPPTMSDPSPSGSLPAGTTEATLQIHTNEDATCKYGTSSLLYNRLTNTFSTTGGKDHSTKVDVESGKSYKYYVRCQDESGNATAGFVLISFNVGK